MDGRAGSTVDSSRCPACAGILVATAARGVARRLGGADLGAVAAAPSHRLLLGDSGHRPRIPTLECCSGRLGGSRGLDERLCTTRRGPLLRPLRHIVHCAVLACPAVLRADNRGLTHSRQYSRPVAEPAADESAPATVAASSPRAAPERCAAANAATRFSFADGSGSEHRRYD